MLFAAVSVMIVVATGDPADGSTQAMEQAMRAALGAEATIAVRPLPESSSDETLLATANGDHATLLVVVSWSDRQRRVTLRFVKPADGRWADREIRFDTGDAANERGRTVGFALVSMVPENAPEVPAVPPPIAVQTAVAARDGGVSPRVPPGPNPLALEASASAVAAPGGYGGGVGGLVSIRLPLAGALGARGSIGARAGEIAPAQATSRVIVGAVGLAWQPWVDSARRWAVGGRVDALLLHHDVAHLSEDDPDAVHQSRLIPGVDVAAEGAYRFAEHAAVVAASGTEIAMGTTEVMVHGRQVASVRPVRLMAELGLRVSF